MTIELFIKINQVQIVLSTLFVAVSFLFFNRTGPITKVLAIAFAFGLVAYVCLGLFNLKGKQVNVPQNIDGIIYLCIVTFVYYLAVGKRYGKAFLIITIVFVIFAVINIMFIQKMDNNTYTKVIRAIILIFYCVLYCYRLMIDLPVKHLLRVPMFWYNSGILIYNAGALFLYLFTNYLVEVLHNDLLIYWSFHNLLNIVQTLVIIGGLWADLQTTRKPLPQSAK